VRRTPRKWMGWRRRGGSTREGQRQGDAAYDDSGEGGAAPKASKAAPEHRGVPGPVGDRKRETSEVGRRWPQMGKNRTMVTWLTGGGNDNEEGGGQGTFEQNLK
jgi:hypothetical protein